MVNYQKEHAALMKLEELGWFRVPAAKGSAGASGGLCSASQSGRHGVTARVVSGRTWVEVLAAVNLAISNGYSHENPSGRGGQAE
jgi:hypothetical protein